MKLSSNARPGNRRPCSGLVLVAVQSAFPVCALLLFTMGATAQDRIPDSQGAPAIDAKFVTSFTGPGALAWKLPPAADLSLRIIAGNPEPSPEKLVMKQPVAVVTDSRGRLLVADTGSLVVHIFDFATRHYSQVDVGKSGMQSIAGLALDNKNNVYLSDVKRGQIFIFTAKGKFVGHLQDRKGNEAEYTAPTGLAIDHARGDIFVCDRDRNMVIRVSPSGRALQHFGERGGGSQPGSFRRPTQLAIVGSDLFVLDSGNDRIQHLSLQGKFLGQFGVLQSVGGLAADRWKRLLVGEPDMHRVSVYTADGTLITRFGGEGDPQHSAFDPVGLWLRWDQCLYVADEANKRVDLLQTIAAAVNDCRP